MTSRPLILSIDPGPVQSAWLLYVPVGPPDGWEPRRHGIIANDRIVQGLRTKNFDVNYHPEVVVIEQIESFGMAVGREVFDTVWWAGRFAEAAMNVGLRVAQLPRRAVKLTLCGSARAKDSNIRQALIDRFGGSAAIGRKADPGPLYGISKDVWSALAIAVTHVDQEGAAT